MGIYNWPWVYWRSSPACFTWTMYMWCRLGNVWAGNVNIVVLDVSNCTAYSSLIVSPIGVSNSNSQQYSQQKYFSVFTIVVCWLRKDISSWPQIKSDDLTYFCNYWCIYFTFIKHYESYLWTVSEVELELFSMLKFDYFWGVHLQHG